jgi:hypothetical protein
MRQIEALFLGIIAGAGALVIEAVFPLNNNPAAYYFWFYVLVAVLVEEFIKYIIIWKRVDAISLGRSLVLNSFILGLGFSIVELGLLWYQKEISWPVPQDIIFPIALLHITTAGIIGYILVKNNPRKFSTFFKAIFWAVIIHFSFNIISLTKIRHAAYFFVIFLAIIDITMLWKAKVRLE